MKIKYLLIASLAIATMAFAAVMPSVADGAHHAPMGPPLATVCAAKPVAEQFLCLRPGFVIARASLATLVSWSTGGGPGVYCGGNTHIVTAPGHASKCVANPPPAPPTP